LRSNTCKRAPMVTCMDGTRLREVDGELWGWKSSLGVALKGSYELGFGELLMGGRMKRKRWWFHLCKRL